MRKLYFLLFLSASPAFAYGKTCVPISNPEDVVSCALANHPDITRLQAQASSLGAFESLAKQRPNPELTGETLHSDEEGKPSLEIEAAYLHTFELGGKRGRRMDRARAQKDLVLAQLDRTKEEVKQRTIRNLYRLRQIERELHLVDEASVTFGKIVRQYRSRPRLTPEQEVSLSVFVLAEGDYRLRRSGLVQERSALRQFFDLATGADFQGILNALPPQKNNWPNPSLNGLAALGGAARKEAQAEVAIAQSELSLATSETMPNLGIGPRVRSESGRGESSQAFGASLSMALPLYSRNRGGKAVAEYELKRNQAIFAQKEKEFQLALRSWGEIYQEAVASLQNTPSIEQLEKKHHGIESEFQRGLVSSPLVIEAHRQLTDFTASQNEQELRALEALWSIYTLQGRIMEEKI